MSFSAVVLQVLTGLASASALFLVASGLSLIFGVTRIVNFAHGSFYMLGLYAAVSLSQAFAGIGPLGWWGGVLLAALARRRARRADRDRAAAPALRRARALPAARDLRPGAGDPRRRALDLGLGGPARPEGAGHEGRGRGARASSFPSYDVFSIFVGPLVLGALWLLLTRTRWGLLVRAATQDREMVGALGVNQRWLFTSVFALGTFLAALGGALQMPHEPANLNLDLALIGEAFVVVVVGGMGSIPGAFVAAVLIADGQGVLHRRRLDRRLRRAVPAQQADAGRRVPGDGGGAGLAAVGPVRQAAGRGARPGGAGAAAAAAARGLAAGRLGRRWRRCCWSPSSTGRRRTRWC